MEDIISDFDLSFAALKEVHQINVDLGSLSVPLHVSRAACTDFDLTGEVLWPMSRLMSLFLITHPELVKGERILELGAGTGLPSFVALSLGAKLVHITDGELESVRLCEKSAAALPPSLQQCCQVSQLVWGSQLNLEDHSDYDIIMGSDVIYWESSIRPFCETVQSLLRRFPRAVFYLAYMNRATTVDKRLQDEFRQSGIQTTKIDCDTFWEAPGQIWMLTLHPAVKEQPQMVVI